MLKIGISRLKMYVSEFSPISIRGCFPLLKGHGFKKSPSAFFDQNEVNMIAIGDRIEKYVFFDPIGRLDRI